MPQAPEILGPGSCQGCCAGTRIEVVQSRVSLSHGPSSVGDGIGACSVHSTPRISLPASVGAWNLYVPPESRLCCLWLADLSQTRLLLPSILALSYVWTLLWLV